jgi:hypothetical protein
VALGGIYRQRAQALAQGPDTRAALSSAARAMLYDPFDLESLRVAASLILRTAGL